MPDLQAMEQDLRQEYTGKNWKMKKMLLILMMVWHNLRGSNYPGTLLGGL
jgi:hypothetical protein